MSGLAGNSIGLAEQQAVIGGQRSQDDSVGTSRGCNTNFIGFAKDSTFSDPPPFMFDSTDDTVVGSAYGEPYAPKYVEDEVHWSNNSQILRNPPSGFPAGSIVEIPGYDGEMTYPLVYKLGASRVFSTNIDLVPPINQSGSTLKYYVDPVDGIDTNAGTSVAPFKSIKKAVQAGNWPVNPAEKSIFLKPGLYDKLTGWNNDYEGSLATVTQIVPWGTGDIIVSQHHPSLSWSLVSGAMYSTTIGSGGIATVFDAANPNADGDYQPLAWVASSAAVEAAANSWYLTGTTLYVRTYDGRAPDSDLFAYANVDEPNVAKVNGIMYMEAMKFYGGSRAFGIKTVGAVQQTDVLAKNCEFKYSGAEGLKIESGGVFVFQNCVASMNKTDGFSYGIFNNPPDTPFAMEIDCVGRWNGWNGGTINQGSTCHNGSTVIRINGEYYKNESDNVADVSSSDSWNLGCHAHDSRSGSLNDWSVGNGVGGEDAKMWLDCCTSSGSTPYALKTTPATAIAYVNEFVQTAGDYPGSTIVPYIP